MLTALAAGTWRLVVRGAGDRRTNAELVARRGAGIDVDLGEITPAVPQRLVSEPAISAAAREVAAEMAQMPHPAELVTSLTALAGHRKANAEQLRHHLGKSYPDAKATTIANWVGQIDAFQRRMAEGDLVALPLKGRPAVA